MRVSGYARQVGEGCEVGNGLIVCVGGCFGVKMVCAEMVSEAAKLKEGMCLTEIWQTLAISQPPHLPL